MCIHFQDKLCGAQNYCPAYVEGPKNLCALPFKEHTRFDMHQQAILLFTKSQSSDVTDYASIAKALSMLIYFVSRT